MAAFLRIWVESSNEKLFAFTQTNVPPKSKMYWKGNLLEAFICKLLSCFTSRKCLNVHSVCTNFCLNVHGVCTNLCLNVHSPCLSCSPFEYGKGMYKFVFFANVHIVIEKLSQPWAAATSAAKSARFQVPKNGTSSAQI